MEISADSFMLYPIHINSSKSQTKGRRYSAEHSVKDPSYREIKLALESLGIIYTEDPKKRHPKEQNELGRFTIEKIKTRKSLITDIVQSIRDNRENKKKNETKAKVPNLLNLVPKSRKKSKK